MKLLQRYIITTVLAAIGLVVVMLLGLEIFVLFVKELGDIGVGHYGVWQAFVFVLLQVPQQIYLFFPVASLLGSLLGLGLLASHSELIVMRAAGLSISQIALAVLKAALLLILVVTLVGELFVPRATHFAETQKAIAKSGGQALSTAQGVWIREEDNFIHINNILSDNLLQGVTHYRFNDEQRLVLASFAKRAVFRDGQWILFDVSQSIISKTKVEAQQLKQLVWDVPLNPTLLTIAAVTPDEMTLTQLSEYIAEQRENRTGAGIYALVYWKRLFQPLASCVMMLLAIPFIFGPLRSATMGSRFLAGASVGFGFYLLNQFFGPVSLVYQFPPLLAALLPTLLFATLAILMVRRVR